jgi:hypothetical protein
MEKLSILREETLKAVSEQFKELQEYCESSKAIAEFVDYICASRINEQEEGERTFDVCVGNEIAQFMYEISPLGTSNMGSEFCWVEEVIYFIGNYFIDDSYFQFTQDKRGLFAFRSDNDGGYQDPSILIEAAKAHVKYYREATYQVLDQRRIDPDIMVDGTEVKKLLEVYEL